MKLAGFWSDVVALPMDRFALVTGGAYDILCYDEDGALRWTQSTPQGMWYLRAAALADGTIAMIGQGHDGGGTQIALHYPDGTTFHAQQTTPFFWAQSIIRAVGDHWECCLQTGPRTWARATLTREGGWTPGPMEAVPLWPGGDGSTSQGFAYFTDQGESVWNDPNYVRVFDGVTLCGHRSRVALPSGRTPPCRGWWS